MFDDPYLFMLDEAGEVIPAPDPVTWSVWFEASMTDGSRIVARDTVGDVEVATDFLGVDHAFGQRGPGVLALWETMIFGGERDCECYRSQTRAGALAVHAQLVEILTEEAQVRQDLRHGTDGL